MDPTIYKNIRKIRELKNLTRKYVADNLGMTNSGYSKIERGEVDLTISKLATIASVLGVSLEFLFKFNPTDFFNNLKEKEQIKPSFDRLKGKDSSFVNP